MTRILLSTALVAALTNIVAAQSEREHVCAAKSEKGSALTTVFMFMSTDRPDNVVLCRYADDSVVELVKGKCDLSPVDIFGHGPRDAAVAAGYHQCNADANDPQRCRARCSVQP